MGVEQIKYTEKRKKWMEALSGKDRNEIVNKILSMKWDVDEFSVVNEERSFAN